MSRSARQKHQDVPRLLPDQLVHGRCDLIPHLRLRLVGPAVRHAVPHFDRVAAPRNLQHRDLARHGREVIAKAGRVNRGRRDDATQLRAFGQQTPEVAQQEVDVERPFVSLVQDDRVVLVEEAVAGGLGQQDPVGHQLDIRLRPRPVREADLETDILAQRRVQLLRQTRGDGAGRQPPRLRVPDEPIHPPADVQADLGQLCRLPRPRLAAHDDHLVTRDGVGDFLPAGVDRQGAVVDYPRQPGLARGAARGRTHHVCMEPFPGTCVARPTPPAVRTASVARPDRRAPEPTRWPIQLGRSGTA